MNKTDFGFVGKTISRLDGEVLEKRLSPFWRQIIIACHVHPKRAELGHSGPTHQKNILPALRSNSPIISISTSTSTTIPSPPTPLHFPNFISTFRHLSFSLPRLRKERAFLNSNSIRVSEDHQYISRIESNSISGLFLFILVCALFHFFRSRLGYQLRLRRQFRKGLRLSLFVDNF